MPLSSMCIQYSANSLVSACLAAAKLRTGPWQKKSVIMGPTRLSVTGRPAADAAPVSPAATVCASASSRS